MSIQRLGLGTSVDAAGGSARVAMAATTGLGVPGGADQVGLMPQRGHAQSMLSSRSNSGIVPQTGLTLL